MKVAVPARGQNMEAQVAPRFGRCTHFVIVDTETGEFHAVLNAGGKAGEGAGIQAAQTLVNEGVEAVIGKNLGPKAFMSLKYAGVRMYGGEGTVSEVIEQLKKGALHEMESPNVPKKAGYFTR